MDTAKDVLAGTDLKPCVMCGAPCRVEPGHIYVGLDFKPGEEGLPDVCSDVLVLRKHSPRIWVGSRVRGGWRATDPFGNPRELSPVTHYAEIPEIRGG